MLALFQGRRTNQADQAVAPPLPPQQPAPVAPAAAAPEILPRQTVIRTVPTPAQITFRQRISQWFRQRPLLPSSSRISRKRRKDFRWFTFVIASFLAAGLVYFVIFSGALPFGEESSSSPGNASGGIPPSSSAGVLDGCYDTSGSVYSLFKDESSSVNQTSAQCKAVLDMGKLFGFPIDANTTCSQNTTFTSPSDASSLLSAQFCNEEAVYYLHVENPPIPLPEVPQSFASFNNLSTLGMNNAFYGDKILAALFDTLQYSKYFQVLNMTGSTANSPNTSRILNGSIPELNARLADSKAYFIEFWVANNNLSGSIPSTLADNMQLMTVSNNTLLSGPLPASINANKTKQEEWTAALRCGLTNTTLCIPPSWKTQPACLRNAMLALPTCGGGEPKPLVEVDPKSKTNGFGFGSGGSSGSTIGTTNAAQVASGVVSNVSKIVALMFGIVLLGSVGSIMYVQGKKLRKTRQSSEGSAAVTAAMAMNHGGPLVDLELQRANNFGLPEYTLHAEVEETAPPPPLPPGTNARGAENAAVATTATNVVVDGGRSHARTNTTPVDTSTVGRKRALLLTLALFVFAVVAGGGLYWYLFGGETQYQQAEGCYDADGRVFDLLDKRPVDQSGTQCQAVLSMAAEFGFTTTNVTCSAKTVIKSGSDNTSYLAASFCDVNTVYNLTVTNPPRPSTQLPASLPSFPNLAVLEFHNALAGSNVLAPLIQWIETPKYLRILDLSGSIANQKIASRVLTGTIPEFSYKAIRREGMLSLVDLQNNNLTGTVPSSLGDTMAFFSVANNTLLSGPLPSAYFSNITKSDRWTEARQCSFVNTSLCIPASWTMQPTCLLSTDTLMSYCNTTTTQSTPPPRATRPSTGVTGYFVDGRNFSILSTMVSVAFFAILCISFWVYLRRRQMIRSDYEQQQQRGGDRYVYARRNQEGAIEMRPVEELLPAYVPEVPKYEEAAAAAAGAGQQQQQAPLVQAEQSSLGGAAAATATPVQASVVTARPENRAT
ncbi:hypothetical protein HDU77_009230 [Chytriomyces hyalinus]|nr:hypothetical protein HDU77_009230 [Chytriomyces hyalinus]